ncbi:MAG: hypothetical protein J5952_10355 [Prevotella sp.]|jgi:UDP-3-O-[3-hydroxymyristoyl] glucosamine N-acyltransferase|nr:hypothetical protein [Prevotella sp.]
MTEFEKMRSEEFYDFTSEECLTSYYRAKHICAKLQTMTVEDEDYRQTIEELIPDIPESSTVCPGVTIGDRCIIGAGSVVVKDIPSDSMAVGNPCRVIRKILR